MTNHPRATEPVSLAAWSGPYGGVPPLDRTTPKEIERAFLAGVDSKRTELRAIAADMSAPTFENTIEALEDSGRDLRRVEGVLRVFTSAMASDEMRAVSQRLAPVRSMLEDEAAHDEMLFSRVESVYRVRTGLGLSPEQLRLTETLRNGFVRRGAGLPAPVRQRLGEINGRIAALIAHFNRNMVHAYETEAVFMEDEADLDGLSAEQIAMAAAAARNKGRPGQWAIPNVRPAVWPFLTHSKRRDLRERVWRMWTDRCDGAGEHGNLPVIAEILRLRGEKARLLGYPSFAHFATSDRMAKTPETALALLEQVWPIVVRATNHRLAQMQAIADREGTGITLAPWDRLHYAEVWRREKLGLDSEQVRPYLELHAMMQAMFWAAGEAYRLTFKELPELPRYHPDVSAYEVSRDGEPIAVMLFDLFQRAGKNGGNWAEELRTAENFRRRELAIASVNSNILHPGGDQPVLLTWEAANVLFHEFGHALHMVCSEARYPSLGSLSVPWDFIELPALFTERWLRDHGLLARFARHHVTGDPMPQALLERIEETLKLDRVFTLNLDALGPAIVDLRMHLLADGLPGHEFDPVALENEVLQQLGMPPAWDVVMRVPHSFHSFSEQYAAGVYVYLWADVMAAEAAEVFLRGTGGLLDPSTAERWRKSVLSVGSTVPAAQAFREFLGRDPTPEALLRRFDLLEVEVT